MPTIPEALSRAAREFGPAEAIADGATRLSFTDLLDEVRTAARFYLACGVEPGDHVAVWAPNTHHWVIAALGVHYAVSSILRLGTGPAPTTGPALPGFLAKLLPMTDRKSVV